MKQHIVRILHAACLCLAVSLPAAFAQDSQTLTVNLPFAFEVNNKQFPAGQYRIAAGAGQAVVQLRGVDNKQAVFSLSLPIDSKKTREYPALIFNRYGNRYFLSQIWAAGSITGRGLPAGSAEREVAQRWAQSASTSGSEVLAVLARPDAGK